MNTLKHIKSHNLLVVTLVFTLMVASGCGALRVPFTDQTNVDNLPAPSTRAERLAASPLLQGPSLPDQELLAQLYDNTAPSVVNIQVLFAMSSGPEQQPQLPFEFPFPGSPFEQPQVPQGAEGSSFIYDDLGHIVTNNHVIENAESIIVNFANGMWADAELVATDPQADLAVLKVTPPEGVDWEPLTLAKNNGLRVGHYVIALGSPFGLDETMTLGIVSAIGRSFRMGDPNAGTGYSLPDIIQTDTAINPGNSGGPCSIWLAKSLVSILQLTRPAVPMPGLILRFPHR
jgi:2-alkenal reductase